MAWANFHSHNHYCDGKQPIEDHVSAALETGMKALGISSHAPVPFENRWSMKPGRLDDYILEIETLKTKYKDDICLYKGLEVDYIPGKVTPGSDFVLNAGLDYTIGSIHFVGIFDNGENCAIDGPKAAFEDGLNKIFGGEIRKFVHAYYELTRNMIAGDCPDIIGHMDKIKMHSLSGKYFDEQSAWYRDEVMQTLEMIPGNNAILEVNTRGIYKKKIPEPYPSAWILKEAAGLGIPVILNSDSHHPVEIVGAFEETSKLLLSLGFRTQRILLTDAGWQDVPFDEQGLIG